jgi:hypothetical protein
MVDPDLQEQAFGDWYAFADSYLEAEEKVRGYITGGFPDYEVTVRAKNTVGEEVSEMQIRNVGGDF